MYSRAKTTCQYHFWAISQAGLGDNAGCSAHWYAALSGLQFSVVCMSMAMSRKRCLLRPNNTANFAREAPKSDLDR